jgi:hypothetical protein
MTTREELEVRLLNAARRAESTVPVEYCDGFLPMPAALRGALERHGFKVVKPSALEVGFETAIRDLCDRIPPPIDPGVVRRYVEPRRQRAQWKQEVRCRRR